MIRILPSFRKIRVKNSPLNSLQYQWSPSITPAYSLQLIYNRMCHTPNSRQRAPFTRKPSNHIAYGQDLNSIQASTTHCADGVFLRHRYILGMNNIAAMIERQEKSEVILETTLQLMKNSIATFEESDSTKELQSTIYDINSKLLCFVEKMNQKHAFLNDRLYLYYLRILQIADPVDFQVYENVLERMKSNGVRPASQTCNYFLRACLRYNNENWREIYDTIKNYGGNFDGYALPTIMSLLTKSRPLDAKECERIIDMSMEQDDIVVEEVCSIYVDTLSLLHAPKLKRLKKLVSRYEENGRTVPISVLTALFREKLSKNSESLPECLDLLDKCVKNGTKPHSHLFFIMMSSLMQHNTIPIELCQQVFQSAKSHNVSPCKDLLSTYVQLIVQNDKFHVSLLDQILRDVEQHPKEVISRIFSSCFLGLLSQDPPNTQVSSQILEKMHQLGLSPPPFTIASLINIYSRQDPPDTKTCFKLLHDAGDKCNNAMYRGVMTALSRENPPNVEMCESLYEEMINRGIKPSPSIFSSLIKVYGTKKNPEIELCRKIFMEMLSQGIDPDVWVFNSLLEITSKSRSSIKSCESLFQYMKSIRIRPNCITFGILMNAYAKNEPCNLQRCQELLTELEEDGYKPTGTILGIYLSAVSRSTRDTDHCWSIIEKAKQIGIKPNGVMYGQLILCHAFGNPPDLDECSRIIEIMKQEGIEITEELYVTYLTGLLRRPVPLLQEAKMLVEQAIEMGILKTAMLLNMYLSALIKSKASRDHIHQTLSWMSSLGFRPDSFTVHSLLHSVHSPVMNTEPIDLIIRELQSGNIDMDDLIAIELLKKLEGILNEQNHETTHVFKLIEQYKNQSGKLDRKIVSLILRVLNKEKKPNKIGLRLVLGRDFDLTQKLNAFVKSHII